MNFTTLVSYTSRYTHPFSYRTTLFKAPQLDELRHPLFRARLAILTHFPVELRVARTGVRAAEEPEVHVDGRQEAG